MSLFIKCLHPLHVTNPYNKEQLIVPCGKCSACRNQINSINTLKIQLESKMHKYCYFVTLTYSNEHVPYLYQVYDSEYKKFRFFDPETGEDFGTTTTTYTGLKLLIAKTNLPQNSVPFLNKYHLQKFFKRLRYYLKKNQYEDIRYYACGEYGPVHFRPHYHLLLWFEERKTAEALQEYISKSWPYGRIDVQASKGKCASYVSSYLNSFSNLPQVLTLPKTKPFSTHSRFLGEAILLREREEIYKMSARDFTKRSFQCDGFTSDFTLWRSLKTYYYPRCRKYYDLTQSERIATYRVYAEVTAWTRKTKPIEQAVELIMNRNKYESEFNWLYYLIDMPPYVTYDTKPLRLKRKNSDKEEDISFSFDTTDSYNRFVRAMYMVLRQSQHFLSFVCDGNIRYDNCLYWYKRIDQFYKDLDMLNLTQQFHDEIDFLSDGYEVEELNCMYVNKFEPEEWQNTIYYQRFKSVQLERAEKSIKHKVLQDKNKIFFNL